MAIRLRRCGAVVLVVALGLAAGPGAAHGQPPQPLFLPVVTVQNPNDGPINATCLFGGQGCTLRGAITRNRQLGHPNQIILAAGTFTLSIARNVNDDDNTGDLDIRRSLLIIGQGVQSTIIDGGEIDRVFEVHSGAELALVNLTVRNGSGVEGGGMLVESGGTATLDLVHVTGNEASLNGGGIHSFGTLTIRRSTISNNRAMGFTGGGGLLLDGPFTLANVTISGNRATRSGGGLYALAAQVLSLTNVTIAENVSENFAGAGIFANMSPKFGRLAVKNTVVANNRRPSGTVSNCSGAIPLSIDSLGGNLDSQNTCGFGSGPQDQVNTDPLLFPLRINDLGFPGEVLMPTHGIPNASPLTDNGLNDGCPATDARNLTRPRDSNGDGSAICDIGALEGNGPTGLGLWQPQESEAKAGQQATFTFSWAVPPPQVWRDLRSLELRLVRNGNVAFWLFWDQQSNAFQLVDPTTRQPVGPARQPGSAGDLATALVSLALGSTQAVGSGPTGVLTTLKLPLTFAPAAVGQTFTVESKAVTDAGALQGFETVGTVTVVAGEAGVEPDTKNDENNERRLTEEQRRQRQRTNTGGVDDDRTEGNVLQTDCEVDPPVATIANRDGEQRVVFLYDTKPYCRSLKPGDYLESEGEKQSEAEFWAHEVSATRGGQRVR